MCCSYTPKTRLCKMDDNEILTPDEAAKFLKVSTSLICRKANSKEIPAIRLGRSWRFPRSSLNRWINKQLGIEEEVKLVGKEA